MSGLMAGRRGLVMGVANDHSIAWGIAKRLAAEGAELALTYQPPNYDRRVKPLAALLGCDFVIPCDVGLDPDNASPASIGSMIAALKARWQTIDFVVHAVAFSDKNELRGRYAETTRANFANTMLVSCFSLTEIVKRAAPLMTSGGSVLTLTYGGASRVMPNYNVMGVAKAALEASVRYLAVDFGAEGIRVNAISAGPVRTLAGSGVADSRMMYSYQKNNAPLRRGASIDEIGGAAVYLLSDLSSAVTGEIHFVDSGYNIISMPRLDVLKTADANDPAAEEDRAAETAQPASGVVRVVR